MGVDDAPGTLEVSAMTAVFGSNERFIRVGVIVILESCDGERGGQGVD
jgi:hypothetical protein